MNTINHKNETHIPVNTMRFQQTITLSSDTARAVFRVYIFLLLIILAGCQSPGVRQIPRQQNDTGSDSRNEKPEVPVPASGHPRIIFPDGMNQDVIDAHLDIMNTACTVLRNVDPNCDRVLKENDIDFEITLDVRDAISKSPLLDAEKKAFILAQPYVLDSATLSYEDQYQKVRHLIILEEITFKKLGYVISTLNHEFCHIHNYKDEQSMDSARKEVHTISMSISSLENIVKDLKLKKAPESVIAAVQERIESDKRMLEEFKSQTIP